MSDKGLEAVLANVDALRGQVGGDFHERLVEATYADAARIADRAVTRPQQPPRFDLDRTIDRLVTSPAFGFPLMLLMMTVVFWLTIAGANVPSSMLGTLLLDNLYRPLLKTGASAIGTPWWLDGFLIDGVYLAMGLVISVILPPMAIFFPLFTLLEDFGYLPRVAFNLDNIFRKSGAHGKQALSMAMGWGCNAAGIIATRIIDSPRERLIAIITNNFALCNGRWPTQILVATVFIGALIPSASRWPCLGSGCRGHSGSRRRVDLRGFVGAFAHRAQRRSFHLQLGITSLSPSAYLADHLYIAHRPHYIRSLACNSVGGTRWCAHLAQF